MASRVTFCSPRRRLGYGEGEDRRRCSQSHVVRGGPRGERRACNRSQGTDESPMLAKCKRCASCLQTLAGARPLLNHCQRPPGEELSRLADPRHIYLTTETNGPFPPSFPLQVKQEVWDALLKRYGYQEVTDMLALMHSASVIRKAVRAMRQRKWTRKLARIDPEMVEKVERLRKIQVREAR